MAKNDDTPKASSSILDEIQDKLEEALSRKKQDVEKELEEKIKREREEAEKRMKEIDNELVQEKQALIDFKDVLAEFESNKKYLKKQIKEHIDKAFSFQTEIETLTGKTMEELRKVSDLNQQLEDLQQDSGKKMDALKKELEEKFGIVAEVPVSEEPDESEINLEQELDKLRKIKELLNSSGEVGEEDLEAKPEVQPEAQPEAQPEVQPEAQPEAQPEVRPDAQPEEMKPEEVEEKVEEPPAEEPQAEEVKVEEEKKAEEEKEEKKEEEATPAEAEAVQPPEEMEAKPEEEKEAPEEVKPEPEKEGEEVSFQVSFEKLEQFRKGSTNENNAEISYFENKDKIVLDGEYIVSSLSNCFEEAKKLYIRLSQTESPKDQFFLKQEIIKQQETLRKIMLRSIRMCEKDNCSLPSFTTGILNLDVLKNVLEKVSMQNWSNQDDFASFDNFAKELKDTFYTRITPPAEYLQSIMKELEIA